MSKHVVETHRGPTRLILVTLAWACVSASGETLTYVLTPQPDQGRLQVELSWQTKGRSSSTLCVSPRWGLISDVPALLKDVGFVGAALERREQGCWTVRHRAGATLACRYAVDPGQGKFDWASVHYPTTSATFFHGIGNTFLLVPQPGGGAPEEYEVLLRWKLPDGWKAVCSWGAGRHLGARLNVNDLRHSVYLAGPLVTHTARAVGADEVTVVMLDEFGFTIEEFAELAGGIVSEQCTFMQDAEFPPFVVTAVPVGEPLKAGQQRLSGTGLYRSFGLFAPPGAKLTEGVEHLFAHELFHYWNGRVLKREKPEELSYWFTEGFTDYYALRILYESGRWTPKTYAKWINRHIRQYHVNPARNASNEDIRAGYWRERDTVGEVPYQRGLLLGLRWHRLARDRGVDEGLDRLFKTLVGRGRAGEFKVSNEGVREAGRKLLGEWFAAEFDRYVTRAETVEVPTDALVPELVGEVTATYLYELGFDRARSLSEGCVRGLLPGSAAAAAGLRDGDELAGWTVPGDADEKVRLRVRRDGRLETISYFPRGRRSDVLQFRPATSGPSQSKSGGPRRP